MRIDPELSISRVTTVSRKSVSRSRLLASRKPKRRRERGPRRIDWLAQNLSEPKDRCFALFTDNLTDSTAVADAISEFGQLVELSDQRLLGTKAQIELWPKCLAGDRILHLSQVEILQLTRERLVKISVQ